MSRSSDLPNDPVKSRLQARTARVRKAREAAAAVERRAAAPRRNDLVPAAEIVTLPIDALKPANRRTRKTEPARLERIIHSVQTFGQAKPVLIDPDHRIVRGHSVWAAMKEMKLATINCIVVDHLTPEQRRAFAIADARLGETGSWDFDELRVEMEALTALDFDLEVTAFTPQQIDIILSPNELAADNAHDDGELEDDDAPLVARPGDLFALGYHRVICGDALDDATYVRLLDGAIADVVVADSPYNLPIAGVVSGLGKTKHADFVQGVGEMNDAEFTRFLATFLGRCTAHCKTGAAIYAFMDWRQIDLLLTAGRDVELKRLQIVVWNKGVGAMGSPYRSAHELCAVFCKGDTVATNNVELGRHGRDRTNVWTYPGATRRGSSAAEALADHPTPKPVEMIADALRDVSERGAIVLDPFLGSGTTVMAAEAAGRIAYGIEIEPKYIDRAIRRWQRATGEDAVHVESELSFAALARVRHDERADPTQSDGPITHGVQGCADAIAKLKERLPEDDVRPAAGQEDSVSRRPGNGRSQ